MTWICIGIDTLFFWVDSHLFIEHLLCAKHCATHWQKSESIGHSLCLFIFSFFLVFWFSLRIQPLPLLVCVASLHWTHTQSDRKTQTHTDALYGIKNLCQLWDLLKDWDEVSGIRFHLETRGVVSGGSWPVPTALVHSALWVWVAFSSLGENGSREYAEVVVQESAKGLGCLFRTGVVSGITYCAVSGMWHIYLCDFFLLFLHRFLNGVCLLVSLTISGTKVVGFIWLHFGSLLN